MEYEPQLHQFRDIQLLKTETLGCGAYGVVYKAMCDQRLCAAKLLHPIFFNLKDPGVVTTRTWFIQECCLLSEMKHPNIVEFLGTTHDPDSGNLVLLMELMTESLTHFLEYSHQPLAYHIEVDLCHDIAQALAYIHSNDIIHRDLSSNNILLIAGKAKITDFGMSKLLDNNPSRKPLTMCPGASVYMPPEALIDQPIYSQKIDCFSFGVLEIQIMTRQFPDPGPRMEAVEDSRSRVGKIHIPVLDSERRKSHIDLTDPTHALLPIALSCLSYSEEDRPSSQNLCQQLTTIKETPRYTQSAQQAQEIRELQQQVVASDGCIFSLQQQLQTKDQQLQDSQGRLQDSRSRLHTLQQEKQSQIEQLSRQVEEKQHTIENREQQLWQLNKQLQVNEQLTVQFQQNLLQREQTIRELRQFIDQIWQEKAVEEKKNAAEPRKELVHEPNEQQLQLAAEPLKQETISKLNWKQSKVPKAMFRGSIAVDANIVYCNGGGSTAVHTYDLKEEVWGRVKDCTYKWSCLVIAQGILTAVGGKSDSGLTNLLLSLTGDGTNRMWSPHFPAMKSKRRNTAALCYGHSLIVAGGCDAHNRLDTVEVLDTNTRQWFTACSLLYPYSQATLAICGNRLYMLGGWNQHGRTRSVLTCSVPELLQSCQTQSLLDKKQVWQHVADTPHKASTCFIFGGCLIVVGGIDEANKETTNMSTYNEQIDCWETMAGLPTARSWALVAIVSGKIFVIGGVIRGTSCDTVEIGSVV